MPYNSKEKQRDYYNRNRERINAVVRVRYAKDSKKARAKDERWRERHPEELKKSQKKYYYNNKQKILAKVSLYQKKTLDRFYPRRRAYYAANRERLKAEAREYYHKKVLDTNYRLAKILRSRLKSAIRHGYKGGSAVKDLGCSITFLKKYLEDKFKPGMNWNNWTGDGWHIDHIKALSTFDLSNPLEIKIVCHYTNLQPLWAKENIIKSNK